MSEDQYLSRGIDHLGDLGAKLRDLQGFSTLAFELIQNADDVPEATLISFNVCEDALIVDNNGVFSDCKHMEKSECPWRDEENKAYRCDYHRFRKIASGDKRKEAETTGAFGIGFIAVYQVTDNPELISAGRHWILHEDKPEEKRIKVCTGCAKCKASDLPGTRFILPWAHEQNSPLRRALQAEPVSPDAQRKFIVELEKVIPVAMLFLKRINKVDVKKNGQIIHTFERVKDKDCLMLSDGNSSNDRIWYIIEGEFSEDAGELRRKYPNKIEEKKSSKVTLALPKDDLPSGLLCAYLPTQQDTKLPFHINADFFTTNDRKRVYLAEDFQSEWNKASLKAAAAAIANSIERLTSLLGHKRFWGFLSTIKQVSDTERGEPAYAQFWKEIEPELKSSKIVYTTKNEWVKSDEAVLLLHKEEAAAIPVLERMQFKIVHEDLRPYQGYLRFEAVGVPLLGISHLCDVLKHDGLTERTEETELPVYLSNKTMREALWSEISLLLERQQRTQKAKEEDEKSLKTMALAPGLDGAFWPCGEIYKSDKETIALFQSCGNKIPFVIEDAAFSSLAYLCEKFDAKAAIQILSDTDKKNLEESWQSGKLNLSNLFGWFENNKKEIVEDKDVKEKFSQLPIFPSSGKLHKMSDLVLPGDFIDDLKLADIVDLTVLSGRREFLLDIGMQVLDFRKYVLTSIPSALNDNSVGADKRSAVISLLAKRLGEIKDDEDVRNALMGTPLIECIDGKFRKAEECYFKSETVSNCLESGVHFVTPQANRQSAVRDLYEWLGVVSQPRPSDLMARIEKLAGATSSAEHAKAIEKIFAYLGKAFNEQLPAAMQNLCKIAWLPAKGKSDRWCKPNELYAAYQDYLFETQALFLDIPRNIQNDSSKFINLIGINTTPPVDLVVKHVLYCCEKNLTVHQTVYRFLNDKHEDHSLNLLKDKKCLYIDDSYLAPNQVFWGQHPFGRFRRRLNEELRSYSNFMEKIGVREAPDHEDAFHVLNEISQEYGSTNLPLDEEAHSVLMVCWRMLEDVYEKEKLPAGMLEKLRAVKCIPNADKLLHPPEWMFFENRAGLAAKFGDTLKNNVIIRPLGAGKAMYVAGVRTLGLAAEIQLLECTDPYIDEAMLAIILQRSNQLGRVLESQLPGAGALSALGSLKKLQCKAASNLMISYHLSVFGRELHSKPERVPALFQRNEDTIFFVKGNGHLLSWSAIARELAIALFPEEDPGKIAAGIKEVLSAQSAEAAAATLDELGFAGLDTAISQPPAPGTGVAGLGDDTPVGDGSSVKTEGDDRLTDRTPGEALEAILGGDGPSPTAPVKDSGGEPTQGGMDSGSHGGSGKKKTRFVLRTYVTVPDSSDNVPPGDTGDGGGKGRNPVDEAGVKHVLEYEKSCGRNPKEMPHNNPGYDVESKDESAKTIRYIEVKSFSGPWDKTWAVLSEEQFGFGYKNNDLFWLYVVEYAQSDKFKIYRVHNPARKANHFMFDDGWRSVAEAAEINDLPENETAEEKIH